MDHCGGRVGAQLYRMVAIEFALMTLCIAYAAGGGHDNCGNSTQTGPHSTVCLMHWWIEAGCSHRGWFCPDREKSELLQKQLNFWNSKTVREVQEDMNKFYTFSIEGKTADNQITFATLCGNCGADHMMGPHVHECLMKWWYEAGCGDDGLLSPSTYDCAWWHAHTVREVKNDMRTYPARARQQIMSLGYNYKELCGTPKGHHTTDLHDDH